MTIEQIEEFVRPLHEGKRTRHDLYGRPETGFID
jgi:hypothetical protein